MMVAREGDKYEVNMPLALRAASRFRVDKTSEDWAFRAI